MCLRMVAQIAIAGQIEFSRISCLADRQFTPSKPMAALPTLLPCRLCLAPTPALLGREGVARAARRAAPGSGRTPLEGPRRRACLVALHRGSWGPAACRLLRMAGCHYRCLARRMTQREVVNREPMAARAQILAREGGLDRAAGARAAEGVWPVAAPSTRASRPTLVASAATACQSPRPALPTLSSRLAGRPALPRPALVAQRSAAQQLRTHPLRPSSSRRTAPLT